MRLEQKVAVITGGSAGIGRAISELFSEEGAKVVVADINKKGGEETVKRISQSGGDAIFIPTDVSKEKEVEKLMNRAISKFGKIDILVNDAAQFVFGKIEDVTDDDWDRVFGTNVRGAAYAVKHVLPSMKNIKGGAIVNIASISSFVAQSEFVPYNTSKGALLQLTRCLALDLAKHNIRVNCVCPGAILTQATDQHREFIGAEENECFESAAASSFMNRIGDPREVAYAALFLASDEASFITGTPLFVDGGTRAST